MKRRRGLFASDEGLRNLRKKMTEKDFTQEKLADKANVHISQVQRLLNPQWDRKVERNTIEKIAKVLDLQPTDIVSSDEWYYPSRSDSGQRQIPKDADISTPVQEVLSLPAHNQVLSVLNESKLSVTFGKGSECPSPIAKPELLREPRGPVPLNSALYVERVPDEALYYNEILQSGALLRIKGSNLIGKTSFMTRIVQHATIKHGYQTVILNFQQADSKMFTNLDQLLRWFCENVGQGQDQLNQLDDYWTAYGSKDKCSNYVGQCVLKEATSPIVIVLDEVERIFSYPEIADDFFGLLRSWHEHAHYGDTRSKIWEKLRLVMVYSTEEYIPLNINHSPFNVGVGIELQDFSSEQMGDLVRRYGLDLTTTQSEELRDIVGGHPYLVQLALYNIRCKQVTLEHLVQTAPTEAGIYGEHLRRQLENLKQHPDLANAFKQAVTTSTPVELDSKLAFKLHSMGLVDWQENGVIVRYDLYRRYFLGRINKF